MAERVGLFGQLLLGPLMERRAINRNAETLDSVEAKLGDLRETIKRQGDEIVHLRAMIVGLAEVIHRSVPFEQGDLEHAVTAALDALSPRSTVASGDPYRHGPTSDEPSPEAEEIEAAQALLAVAQRHHYAKEFAQARDVYQEIVARHPTTKQAAQARTQLDNLRGIKA
ncbi:MAG: hypothetical protein ABI467_08265 [Kofleriaceae bacterium]